jgi:hypothetical protein
VAGFLLHFFIFTYLLNLFAVNPKLAQIFPPVHSDLL